LTFTLAADANGVADITMRLHDDGGTANGGVDTSTTQTLTITVTAVNDAPVATDESDTTAEDTPLTLNLSALASDAETSPANLTFQIVGAPAHGTATTTTYTPDANFNGTDSFRYSVTDRGDPDGCAGAPPACDAPKTSTGTVTVTVTPVNDA